MAAARQKEINESITVVATKTGTAGRSRGGALMDDIVHMRFVSRPVDRRELGTAIVRERLYEPKNPTMHGAVASGEKHFANLQEPPGERHNRETDDECRHRPALASNQAIRG